MRRKDDCAVARTFARASIVTQLGLVGAIGCTWQSVRFLE